MRINRALLAELALLVGPDRAARLATKAVGADQLVAVVPLLQPIVNVIPCTVAKPKPSVSNTPFWTPGAISRTVRALPAPAIQPP